MMNWVPGSRAGMGMELCKSYTIMLSSVGSLLDHMPLQVITCALKKCPIMQTFCLVLLYMSACCKYRICL